MSIENTEHEISLHFRALDVPDCMVRKFRHDLPDLPIKHSKWAYGPKMDVKRHVCPDGPISIMVIDIANKENCIALQEYLENFPLQCSFGIWVSLYTDWDSDGLTVPPHVVEFLHRIGGTLDFSFVCVADWDEDGENAPKREPADDMGENEGKN